MRATLGPHISVETTSALSAALEREAGVEGPDAALFSAFSASPCPTTVPLATLRALRRRMRADPTNRTSLVSVLRGSAIATVPVVEPPMTPDEAALMANLDRLAAEREYRRMTGADRAERQSMKVSQIIGPFATSEAIPTNIVFTSATAFAIAYVAVKSMGKSDPFALSAGLMALIGMFVIEMLLYICRSRKVDMVADEKKLAAAEAFASRREK